jgi:hypothetical protein
MHLDEITAQVERTKTVAGSAVVLINGLAARLLEVKDDPAAIAKLSSDLAASADGLAAAVTANTPAG